MCHADGVTFSKLHYALKGLFIKPLDSVGLVVATVKEIVPSSKVFLSTWSLGGASQSTVTISVIEAKKIPWKGDST